MASTSIGLLLIASLSVVLGQLSSTGLSVSFNGIYYYISPYAAGSLKVDAHVSNGLNASFGFAPVTVVAGAVVQRDLPALMSNWSTIDDVFQPAFAQAVFLSSCEKATTAFVTKGSSSAILPLSKGSSSIPSGPYFLEKSTGDIYPVYRLYDDFAGAFAESLLQKPDGTFQPLSAQVSSSATLTVGVPSRLYYTRSTHKPLAGVRIGVKDIFELAGVKTSCGNRAYYNLYPPNNLTGTAISRLIDAGAVIVGLQKPSQFANGEEATEDWVDYHSPFNPRGDGYQDPSSSSSGAGASMASYDWLDAAVGSDTGGSIRGPSEVNGLFGNRPSHNLVSLDHVMPLSTHLDTAGFLLRDPKLWDPLESAMYGSNYTSLAKRTPKYPKTIYTLSFPNSSTTEGSLVNNFASKLATFVGGNLSAINLANMWAADPPAGAPSGVSLSSLLAITYPIFISQEQISLVKEPFFADYAAAHDGRTPFVDPTPLARWAFGASFPSTALDDAVTNKTLFMNWFNSKVLPPVADPDQCSEGLVLYVGSDGSQNTRNQYGNPPSAPVGFSSSRISVFTECPDSVFPVGQVASFSNVTNHEEYLPVTVDILAAKGCDGLLARLAVDLVEAGILTIPLTGGTLTGGDILMRRQMV